MHTAVCSVKVPGLTVTEIIVKFKGLILPTRNVLASPKVLPDRGVAPLPAAINMPLSLSIVPTPGDIAR